MRHTRLYRDGVLEAKDFPAAQISDYLQTPGTVVWLDLCEPDQQDLEVVSEEFGLHPLAVEDAVQQHERPKLDRYQDHAFLTVYAVSLDPATGKLTRVPTNYTGDLFLSAWASDGRILAMGHPMRAHLCRFRPIR